MMKRKQIFICLFVSLLTGDAYASACVQSTFNVTYSCNGGTLSGTLPSDTTATYGKSFSPTVITEDMCTPPSGHIYAGQAILVDGVEVAYYAYNRAKKFTYYYTSDIVIAPHWAAVAEPAVLATNLGINGTNGTYSNGASGTWSVKFYYGTISGISQCSTIGPENNAWGYYTGILAADPEEIEASTSGQYCYCKMTSPAINDSPWVFLFDRGNTGYCGSNCAIRCGYHIANESAFRASIFSATQ